jgi:hypothetical protein
MVPSFEAELQRRLAQFDDQLHAAAAPAPAAPAVAASAAMTVFPLSPHQRAAVEARTHALAAARERALAQWQLNSPTAYGYNVSAALTAPLPADGGLRTPAHAGLAPAAAGASAAPSGSKPGFAWTPRGPAGTPAASFAGAGPGSTPAGAAAAAAAAAARAAGVESRADVEAELAALLDRVRALGIEPPAPAPKS